MIQKIYSVYDKLTGYMSLITAVNKDVAIRSFAREINSPEINLINANVEDFNLQWLGDFDTETGVITSTAPTIVADAGSLLRKEIK